MSGTRKDGGPAYPSPGQELTNGIDYLPQPGMSLRDAVALAVLAAMHGRDSYDDGQATPEQRARLAFLEAAAFLAERERQP